MRRSDLTIGGIYAYTTVRGPLERPARKVEVIDLDDWVDEGTMWGRIRRAESYDPPASRGVLVRYLTGRAEGQVDAVLPRQLVMPWDEYADAAMKENR